MQHSRDRHQKNRRWATRPNHDDFLERLTGGMGTVELTPYDELQLLDTGAWMVERFTGMRIPRLEEAVRFARESGSVFTWIKQTKASPRFCWKTRTGRDAGAGRLWREWEDVRALYPNANRDAVAYINPGCNAAEVKACNTG